MAGLIDTEMGGTTKKLVQGADVFEATATGYDPEKHTVDAGKETVAGQMDSLLSKDSPYLTRARAGATQTANRRGLINSSMAAGAGEAAAIDAALPIASSDANIYGTAARDNQAAGNRALEFGAGESNTTSRLNAEAGNQIGRMTHGAGLEKGLIESRMGAEKELIGSRTEAEKALITAQEGSQSRLSAQQAAQQQAQAQVQAELEKGLITSREQAETRLAQLAGEIEKSLIGERAGAESTLLGQRTAAEKEITELRGALETQLQTLRGNQAQTLANIEANFRSLIQANDSAGVLYQDMVRTIGAIMGDPMTNTTQKEEAVSRVSQMLQSGLTIIGAVANIDLAGLLDFGAEQGG